MNYVDVFYHSKDGLRLYARDYPGPRPDAPVLLCLPGLTRNSKDFEAFANELRRTHRVICPDQRGRGRSQRDPDATRYRPDQYVLDMIVLLDLLGISDVVLIGTSLGGLMAIIMMATAPTRVRAAVLNDIGPEVDRRGLDRIAGYVGKTAPVRDWDAAADQAAFINGVAFPDYQREDWRAMSRELFIQEDSTPVLDYDPAIAQGIHNGATTPNLWPLFEQACVKPILVIRGETSDILSGETLAEMKRRLPHITAQDIANRGHAPTLREPQAQAAIAEFLGSLSKAT